MKKRERLSRQHAVLKETYAAMQLFRQLGFPSANLYLTQAIAGQGVFTGKLCAAVQLNWRGKTFVYTTLPLENTKKFATRWQRLLEQANNEPDNPRWAQMYQTSQAAAMHPQVVAALVARGIVPPGNLN